MCSLHVFRVHVRYTLSLPRRLSKHVDYADPPLPVPLAVHVRPLHLPPELLHVGYADPPLRRQKWFQIWVSTSVTPTPLTRIVPNMGVHVGYIRNIS